MIMTQKEQAFYNYVLKLALDDQPCPRREVIAKDLGVSNQAVSHVIRSLRGKKAIAVEVCNLGWNRGCQRIVHLVAHGISTGKSHDDLPPAARGLGSAYDSNIERELLSFACDALLRRQLETGAHWIRDPAQFQAACESVGLEVVA
jgi:hypothetical protein